MNSTSSRNTIANGATSNWPRNILALRGNFIGRKNWVLDLQTLGYNVHDFSRGTFHIQHDRIYPADEVVVSGVSRNRDRQSCCSVDQSLPNAIRQQSEMRVQPLLLHQHE